MRLAFVTAVAALTALLPGNLAADQGGMPRFQHVFLIILENHDYCQILASPPSQAPAGNCPTSDNTGGSAGEVTNAATNAPNLNALAAKYAVATNYYGVTHPSEPNYVAGIGGTYLGIQDDDAYSCRFQGETPPPPPGGPSCNSSYPTPPGYPNHTSDGPNLGQQLDNAGLTWKGYFQSLPDDPAQKLWTCYPGPGSQCLYASKHNGFINFDSERTAGDLAKMVSMPGGLSNATNPTPGLGQLATDLQTGNVPNFSYIVPDQCHDMHGLGTTCPNDAANITTADAYTASIVNAILQSKVWKQGNNAILITVDEGNTDLSCCVANPNGNPGGGNVATIAITNHGPQGGFTDPTPYNHYSMLKTIEHAFNLDCIANACDPGVNVMLPLMRK